jgi:hypothetical protein
MRSSLITLELLQVFTNSDIGLKYKSHIRVIGYKVYDKWIHIMFDDMGETINQATYYKWLEDYRNERLESIGI